MPQVFKIGSYWVYFWANENKPLEPVHVHVSKGKPNTNATKFWITKSGRCLLANNNSGYDSKTLNYLSKAIELDRAMAYLLEQLKVHNRLEETAILFFADHHP